MDLQFSVAHSAQESEMADVLLAAFTPYVQQMGYLRSGPYPWLLGAIEQGRVYVAQAGNRIVGVMCVTPKGAHWAIDQLGIDPGFQGQGIGRFMMAETEARARDAGAKKITLFTVLMMDDLLRFYERHGYRESHQALPAHGEDSYLRVHFVKEF